MDIYDKTQLDNTFLIGRFTREGQRKVTQKGGTAWIDERK